jgi:hypothetical protein
MDEREKLLNSFKKGIQSAIDKVAKKHLIDLAFYGFEVKLIEYNSDFSIAEETIILDTTHHGKCMFCGEKTYYYDNEQNNYICASCFGKINANKEGA